MEAFFLLYVLEIFSTFLALLAFFLLHRPTLVFSLTFFIKIKKAIKMADDHAFDAFYEFNGDCFYRKAKVNDEQVSEAKINYSDITCFAIIDALSYSTFYIVGFVYFPLAVVLTFVHVIVCYFPHRKKV